MLLHSYCTKVGMPQPVYTTEETPVTRVFRVRAPRAGPRSLECAGLTADAGLADTHKQTTVEVDGRRYGTTNWHKS